MILLLMSVRPGGEITPLWFLPEVPSNFFFPRYMIFAPYIPHSN